MLKNIPRNNFKTILKTMDCREQQPGYSTLQNYIFHISFASNKDRYVTPRDNLSQEQFENHVVSVPGKRCKSFI